VGDLRSDRRPRGVAAQGAGQRLLVGPRGGADRLAAAFPLGRADRALTRATVALLLPRLLAATRDLAAALRVVGADPTIGELARNGLMQQGPAHLDAENVGIQLECSRRLAGA